MKINLNKTILNINKWTSESYSLFYLINNITDKRLVKSVIERLEAEETSDDYFSIRTYDENGEYYNTIKLSKEEFRKVIEQYTEIQLEKVRKLKKLYNAVYNIEPKCLTHYNKARLDKIVIDVAKKINNQERADLDEIIGIGVICEREKLRMLVSEDIEIPLGYRVEISKNKLKNRPDLKALQKKIEARTDLGRVEKNICLKCIASYGLWSGYLLPEKEQEKAIDLFNLAENILWCKLFHKN